MQSSFSHSQVSEQFDVQELRSPVQSKLERTLFILLHASQSQLRRPTNVDHRTRVSRVQSVFHSSSLLCCLCNFQRWSENRDKKERAESRACVSGIWNQHPLYSRFPDADFHTGEQLGIHPVLPSCSLIHRQTSHVPPSCCFSGLSHKPLFSGGPLLLQEFLWAEVLSKWHNLGIGKSSLLPHLQ